MGLLTNDNMITNPSIFTHNSIISKNSFIHQGSNINFEIDNNDFENYPKNSVDNQEIKKSDPNFVFSPKLKKENLFSNISMINQENDNLAIQKQICHSNMNNVNNTSINSSSQRVSSSSNSSQNVIPTDLTIQASQKFLSISKNNFSK